MSDFWFSFIPEDPRYVLSTSAINKIKKFSWYEDNVTIIVNDTVKFANAGSNFERVSCPFCKSDLMSWWGGAMNEAHSEDAGFIKLDVVTPCCKKNTTLHSFDYYSSQGFYTTIIEMSPYFHQGTIRVPQGIHKDVIRQDLFEITDVKWRVIYTII
ncbi:MAG: hypothetical protein FWC91_07085 [Defluviitaleaceae bacterium]|nr:hypothetical protein [Defluviitaleaceae bacterium]